MSNCLDVQYVPEQPFGNGQPNLRGECSNRGTCNVTSGLCECIDGWTGLSDFFGDPGTDCQIFELAIQIEYALLFALAIGSVIKQWPGLKKRYEDYLIARQNAAAKGKSYSFRQNAAVVGLVIWYAVGYPSFVITCLIRIISKTERIGVTFTITFFFATAKMGFYLGSAVYQPYLYKVLFKGSALNNTKGLKRFLLFINATVTFSVIIYIVTSLVPFISVASDSLQFETYIIYHAGTGFGLVYNSVLALLIYRKAEELLSNSHAITSDTKVLALKSKIKKFQFSVAANSGIFAFIFIMLSAWPFWYNLHDYVQAITWVPFLKLITDTALGTQEDKSSSRARAETVSGTNETDGAKKNANAALKVDAEEPRSMSSEV